jgi:predicted RNase H-like nuclease
VSYVLGVDGCRGGWIAARLDDTSVGLSLAVFPSMTALLAAHEGAECIAIDIPIGLTDGPRLCDVRAREFIGARRSSVFPAPCRAALGVRTYEEAATASLQATGKSLSRQAFAIIPKIREVDDAMSPKLQERVREVHPEVCFRALRGRPLEYAKKGFDGYEERRGLLSRALPDATLPPRDKAARLISGVAPDDILDAMVAAWTARRVVRGEAGSLPERVERDVRGLRMEMVY